jgi:anti-sigma factor RsiW
VERDLSCAELEDLIEAFAAGDVMPSLEQRAHLASCGVCARALALASELDSLLARQPEPQPAADFTARVLSRVRRERWRSEQMLDLSFNLAIGLAVAIGLGGLYAVFAATGLAVVGADVMRVFVDGIGDIAVRTAPQARIYALTTLAMITGLLVWWWADREWEV